MTVGELKQHLEDYYVADDDVIFIISLGPKGVYTKNHIFEVGYDSFIGILTLETE